MNKVLLLRSSAGVFGAERMILELAAGLQKRGIEPVVGVVQNRNQASTELAARARAQNIPAKVFACRGRLDFKTILKLRKYLKERKIDIVHTHGYKANFYAVLSTRFMNIPCLATCHPWTETDYNFLARIYTSLDKVWLRKMDKIVAVSHEVRDQVEAGVPGTGCAVIPNGIEMTQFQIEPQVDLREKLGYRNEDFVIGTIGRLVPEKGFNYLLESAACLYGKLPHIRVMIVGDGPMRYGLAKMVQDLHLDQNARFLGLRNDIAQLLSIMNVFVLPSISEGLPMVLLEAMAAGVPVVATEVGDIPKLIEHGKSGFVLPPRDVEGLTTAIQTLMQNPDRGKEMAKRAQKDLREKFSSQGMADEYIRIYHSLKGRN